MAEKSLEERISALEAQLGSKPIEQHFREQADLVDARIADSFREQAELIDRLFVYRFEEHDRRSEARLESKFDAKLRPLRHDLAVIKHAVGVLLTRLT